MNYLRQGLAVVSMSSLLFLGAVVQSAEAASYTMNNVGDSFSTSWYTNISGINGAPTGTQLSANATFTVTSFSSSLVAFSVAMTNTSSNNPEAGRVNSFGFNTTPNLIGGYITGGTVFDGISISPTGQNFPGGFKVETCTFASNNCSGGAYGSLLKVGQTDNFTLGLMSNGLFANGLTIEGAIPMKFQGTYGSFEVGCCNGNLPIPSSMAVIGAGMLAWGAARRRKV